MTSLRDEARWIVDQIDEAKAMAKALGKPQLATSSIEGGKVEEYGRDGTLVQVIGEQHDGTHTTATVGGPVPPEPVPASVTVGTGSAEIRWNGKFADDAFSPMDLSHVSAHASRLEVFSPDSESQKATITGETGDLATVLLEPGAWTIGLVAVSKSGKWSPMSETVTVEILDYPSPVDIQDSLIELDEKYDGVITLAGTLGDRLDQAATDISDAQGRLDEAGTRLDEVFGKAEAADAKATAATTAASAAQTRADTAKSAADSAAADALAASGLAAGKGKVLVQSAAPAAADRNAVTLWIDTTNGANTPKRWTTGTTWVAVTDKAATDAAAAAATAKSAADAAAAAATAAQTAAGTAQSTANNALTMAGSATKAYYSTSTPSGVARTDRDIWRQVNATKDVIGEWYWDGTPPAGGWIKTLVSSQTISNLDVGKLTVGTGIISDLVAEHIAGRSARFIQLDVSQLVAVTGTMSEAVIAKLYADVVMSRKATFEMLAIGSFDNLNVDPKLEIDSAWSGIAAGPGSGFVTTPLSPDKPSRVTLMTPKTAQSNMALYNYAQTGPNRVQVTPGDHYVAWSYVQSDVPDATMTSVSQRLYFYDAAGAILPGPGNSDGGSVYPATWVPGQWIKVGGKPVEVPAGAVAMSTRLTVYSPTNSAPTPTKYWVGPPHINRAMDGSLTVDGSMQARHIDTTDLAAHTGFIADLTARIVKSDMFVGKEFIGGVFTGNTFQTSNLPEVGMKMDGQGLRAYGPDGGEPVAAIRPDGGSTYQISDPTTGDVLGGFDSAGGAAATTLSVSDETRMDGPVITGGDPLTSGHGSGLYGVTMNGRDLLGMTFTNYADEHPGMSDGNAWLTLIPHGVICNAWHENPTPWYWNGRGGQSHIRVLMTTTAQFMSGRIYQISYRAPAIKQTGTLTDATIGAASVRYSSAGGSINADTGWQLRGSRYYLSGGGAYDTPSMTTVVRCPEDIPAGKVMMGVEVYVYAGITAESHTTSDANRHEIQVIDLGLKRPGNDGKLSGLASQGPASGTGTPVVDPPPDPDPDPVRQYTDTVSATWWQAYVGSSGLGQATGSAYSGAAAQGRTPYYTANGVMRGLVGIPSQESRLNGTTVKKIEVYVYAKSWHAAAGGTACIGVHSNPDKPGSWSSTTNDVKRQKMKRAEGRWITLPSSVHAGFKSGNLRGISFLPPSSSTSTEYYGIFTGSKTKFRFTYTK